jgi:hypothetical protein
MMALSPRPGFEKTLAKELSSLRQEYMTIIKVFLKAKGSEKQVHKILNDYMYYPPRNGRKQGLQIISYSLFPIQM